MRPPVILYISPKRHRHWDQVVFFLFCFFFWGGGGGGYGGDEASSYLVHKSQACLSATFGQRR